jgi:glutamate dehydrogenase/leucine dehydrogenase
MLEDTHKFIGLAAGQLGMEKEIESSLKQANAEHVFEIELSSGKKFPAYRVQHNNKQGPYKGGIRFHPNVSLDEVRTLATLMSLKTAAVGLPLGGGKGGVTVNPRELSADELEELSRKYVQGLLGHIGPDKDIPAPDVNTDSMVIDWMVDEFEKLTGDKSKASFTGKSIANGGSLGRDAATGRGGVLALGEWLRLERKNSTPLTYSVQGFGNVGSFFATTAAELFPHWKLVAASDSEAAVYSPDGLDPNVLQVFKSERGRFKDFKQDGAAIVTNEDLIALDVDVLVLAGLEDAVDVGNVKNVKAKYIVEMANGPVTFSAHVYLGEHDRVVLPDVVANAGGVIVSYLEWVQNKAGEHWSKDEVNEKLAKYMHDAVKDLHEYAAKNDVGLKTAGFVLALLRLYR